MKKMQEDQASSQKEHSDLLESDTDEEDEVGMMIDDWGSESNGS